ncbi:MAG: hypothetical protein NXH95_10760 [Pseudomonadaceae bacterium]|nr:hypothetical protein [Pseudomonadaceae bacterium]
MSSAHSLKSTPALLLGNGPSLKHLDLVKDTTGHHTFGMNAAYRHWEKIDWWPTYYSCLDTVVGDSHYSAIEALVVNSASNGIQKFLVRENVFERIPKAHLGVVDCYEDLVSNGLLPHLPDITTGSHTLLWAQLLGYQTILVAGVDLNYVEQLDQSSLIEGVLEVTEEGQNPNYFFDDYQRPGDRYNIPNPRPNLHKSSWVNASRHVHFPSVVVNLNKDSAVDVFVKNQSVSLSSIGPFVIQSGAKSIDLLKHLNAQKNIPKNFYEITEARVRELCRRDHWCRALVDYESSDANAIALVFNSELVKFRFASSDEVHSGLENPEQLVVLTADQRLLCDFLVLLTQLSTAPRLQRAKETVASIRDKVVRQFVPRRIRRISFYENWLNFLSYYGSARGVSILLLNGGLAYLIGLPQLDFFTVFVAWVLLSLLLPLAHRR